MISYDTLQPNELNRNEWLKLQALSAAAFTARLPHRTSQQIAQLTLLDDPDAYYRSHLDPNTEVGGRFNANQAYYRPRVSIATHGNDIVGFLYSADNVSGPGWQRAIKRFHVAKNYHWLREVAVHPEFSRDGVGATLLRNALQQRDRAGQPVTAYIWPDELPWLEPTLVNLGFERTGSTQENIFGDSSAPVTQARMLARHSADVLQRLG